MARQWLLQMGDAAQKAGLCIQYCMPFPRHYLQSVEIPAVTQIRVSDDYQPGNQQWHLGVASMMAHALGLAPFKDVYWTSTTQSGNPYGKTEPAPDLQSAVATLTAGPVTPGDKIGSTDVPLLKMSVNDDGRILKPSRPATAVDSTFAFRAFAAGGPDGQLTSTYTQIADLRWNIVLAGELQTPFNVTPAVIRDENAKFPAVAWKGSRVPVRFTAASAAPFDASRPMQLPKCGKLDWQIWYTAPVFPNGWTLIGEVGKWVPVSSQRIESVQFTTDEVAVALVGAAGETVTMTFLQQGVLVTAACKLPPDGRATLHVPSKQCN